METTEEIIFAARAYTDYGSPYETGYLNTIRKRHPNGEIIELPILDELSGESNIKYGRGLFNKEIKHFLPLLDRCDVFYMAPINNELNKDGSRRNDDKGELSKGVKIEALYSLGEGKKVYIYKVDKTGDDKFEEIIYISDSEELIEAIVSLNRLGLLNDFPKIREMIKTEKRLLIHPKMMNFYSRNVKVRKLISDFMRGNRDDIEYVRPIVIHEKYPDLPFPIDYLPRGSMIQYDINDLYIDKEKIAEGKYNINDLVGEIHFRMCIFDKRVKNTKLINEEKSNIIEELTRQGKEKGRKPREFKPKMIFNKYVLGVCVVFDIDAPKELKKLVGKVNMFDAETDWYEEFMLLKIAAENWFKRRGLRCLSSTTGNGFNITGEPYWFDERDDNLYDYTNTIKKAVANMNFLYTPRDECIAQIMKIEGCPEDDAEDIYKENYDTEVKCKGVRIDTTPLNWHNYKKSIFTYHAKWNRITLPVAKGRIDKEWLKKMSNLDYFLGDNVERNVDDVIEKSNWDKDNWWNTVI